MVTEIIIVVDLVRWGSGKGKVVWVTCLNFCGILKIGWHTGYVALSWKGGLIWHIEEAFFGPENIPLCPLQRKTRNLSGQRFLMEFLLWSRSCINSFFHRIHLFELLKPRNFSTTGYTVENNTSKVFSIHYDSLILLKIISIILEYDLTLRKGDRYFTYRAPFNSPTMQ